MLFLVNFVTSATVLFTHLFPGLLPMLLAMYPRLFTVSLPMLLATHQRLFTVSLPLAAKAFDLFVLQWSALLTQLAFTIHFLRDNSLHSRFTAINLYATGCKSAACGQPSTTE